MTNSQIFFYPGIVLANFILSLFDTSPLSMDQGIYWLMGFICSLTFWGFALNISIAMIKKAFGFGPPRGR